MAPSTQVRETASDENTLETSGKLPVITSLSPTHGPASGGTIVVIKGRHLQNATGVTFGNTTIPASSFMIVSHHKIIAVAPAAPQGTGATTVNVSVTNPIGTSNFLQYTYDARPPTPIITGLSPATGPVGTPVKITGSNFNDVKNVTFNGIAAVFTVQSPTEIDAVAPPQGTIGIVPVVVTTSAGSSPGFNYTYTTIVGPPAPTSVFPTTGVTTGGDIVTIIGTGLTGTTSVVFGTTPANITAVSDTQVTAITPIHDAGTVPIKITTPGGTNSSLSFTFQLPPVISSITPTSGPIAGGTVMLITGTGLLNTIGVNFGKTPATNVIVVSDSIVIATAPAGAAGVSAVTVITASATSNGAVFQYVAAPTLALLTPASGTIVGGNSVTLTGTGFITATQVFFGAKLATFKILSDTLISAVAPAGSGAVPVTVNNPGGTSGARTYTYF
ncbi:hypothetical protein VE00_05624 [Pseudogymnoascus sp. WSF 3629]|nr:hypothetical protein VE00_05624 [Pseudogymnoascus sp. WSF 3629]